MTHKVCSRCAKELPVENFGPCKRCADGYQYYCKECQKDYRRRREHPSKKTCSKCKKEKPRDSEHFFASRLEHDGLFRVCRECLKKHVREPHEPTVEQNQSHYSNYMKGETSY